MSFFKKTKQQTKKTNKMKKVFLIMVIAMLAVGCAKESDIESRSITFTIENPYTFSNMKSVEANGLSMKDIWVFDYVGNQLMNYLHQNPNDSDWGSPTLNLTPGVHHIYFCASRGINPVVNSSTKTIVFSNVDDTFWKELTIVIPTATQTCYSVTLERIVTRLDITITEPLQNGTEYLYVEPLTWYCGFNYTNGEPTGIQTNMNYIFACYPYESGISGKTVSLYGFSSNTEWMTDVVIEAVGDYSQTYQAFMFDVPFKRNRVTQYSGTIFNSGTSNIILNDNWDSPHTGGW